MDASFGMIGLGTMGRNFLLNIAEHGIGGVGYDLDAAKRELLLKEGAGLPLAAAGDLADLAAKLVSPRNIMLLVPAGPIVDKVIADLVPFLAPDDLIIDGGNSHFTDTERRLAELDARRIGFMGVGVSGGEEGARHGASIMPGGKRQFYDRVAKLFEAVSAKVGGEPCVAYMGTGSAGHFVKMVHNGIEYGMMQLIAEAYDFMRRVLGMSSGEVAEIFAGWNDGALNSFLVEITSIVLRKRDADTDGFLVDAILDTAGQKGTGKWTSQAAMDLGVPVPTIDAAVSMRQISGLKTTRVSVASRFPVDLTTHHTSIDVDGIPNALLAAFVLTYSQGLSLLQAASAEKDYGLDRSVIAKIWRGGCIIRSALLEEIRMAFASDASLPTLLLDEGLSRLVSDNSISLRRMVSACNGHGIPAMCLAASLNYFDAMGSARLPANLIQAQRDYFGAHTYRRLDREGSFHTSDWDKGD